MIRFITDGLNSVLNWIGIFLNNLFIPDQSFDNKPGLFILLPFVALGAMFMVVKFGIRLVKSFAFGF